LKILNLTYIFHFFDFWIFDFLSFWSKMKKKDSYKMSSASLLRVLLFRGPLLRASLSRRPHLDLFHFNIMTATMAKTFILHKDSKRIHISENDLTTQRISTIFQVNNFLVHFSVAFHNSDSFSIIFSRVSNFNTCRKELT